MVLPIWILSPGQRQKLDIFVSPHLIEVFVNDGQYVITHVVYGLMKKLAGKIEELLVEE